MKKFKFIIGLFLVFITGLFIYLVLISDSTLLTHPKGIIAREELNLIIFNVRHMAYIIVPTYIVLLFVAWKYRSTNSKTQYDPDYTPGFFVELAFWLLPSIIIAAMATKNWYATHDLDPYRPIKSTVKELPIQVVALNWKWLFIYPEQGIASLNFVHFPERTPVHFILAADGSPMNSFWIPELSGQIFAMTGMVTPLYIMADGPGEYSGKANEINGDGFSDMRFVAKSSSKNEFERWVADVKRSPLKLNNRTYWEIAKPSVENTITLYSDVEKDLFNKIVFKYMPRNMHHNLEQHMQPSMDQHMPNHMDQHMHHENMEEE